MGFNITAEMNRIKHSSPPISKMAVTQRVLVCLLLFGPLLNNAQQMQRDANNIVFAPRQVAGPPQMVTAQRRPETNVVYAQPAPPAQTQPRYQQTNSVYPQRKYPQLRPSKDTDGAIYQKTINGVSFKIVAMCQEFDTKFLPGLMEFDTLQGGCRFVITFDKSLPASDTVYTPNSGGAGGGYNPPPQGQAYQSPAAERRRDVYPAQPPPQAPQPPPQQQQLQTRTVIVREPAYQQPVPPRQSYPPPPRQEAPAVVRYETRPQAPPPQQQQYAPPPQRQQYANPLTRTVRVVPVQTRYETVPRGAPPRQRAPGPPSTGQLDRYQLEALGVGTLHDPAPTVANPPQEGGPPIPRV